MDIKEKMSEIEEGVQQVNTQRLSMAELLRSLLSSELVESV